MDRQWKIKTVLILMVRMQCLAFRSRQSKLRTIKLLTKGARRWTVNLHSGPRAPIWAKSFNRNQCKEAKATSSKAKASNPKRRTNTVMSQISLWKIIIRQLILQKRRSTKTATWKWNQRTTFIQCLQTINCLMKMMIQLTIVWISVIQHFKRKVYLIQIIPKIM